MLSQVKSMMLTDAGSHEPLCQYRSWNTTIRWRLGSEITALRTSTKFLHGGPG